MAGRGSLAGLMPYGDANAVVMEMAGEAADRLRHPDQGRDRIAACFHTGGTTGRPKIAQRTHGNEVINTWAINHLMNAFTPKTFFCGLPVL